MAKNVFCEVIVTLTFDHKNLISSSLDPSGRLSQIWRNSLKAFLRYCVPQKLLLSYLSQLDLLTHENEYLCGVGCGCGAIWVGERPKNKSQTELSNTPFHWSLSCLSATAGGRKAHLPGLNVRFCLSVYVHARIYVSLSISGWVCDTVFYLSICVREYTHECVREGWIRRAAFLHNNRYRVTSCLDDGFWAWSFNLSTDPHHSLLWWRRGQDTEVKTSGSHNVRPAWPSGRCVSVWSFFMCMHLVKNTHRHNNDEEAILREFCWHKHTCVPFISDIWAGHFTTDLVWVFPALFT